MVVSIRGGVAAGGLLKMKATPGWDPYEVWLTRVRATQLDGRIVPPRVAQAAAASDKRGVDARVSDRAQAALKRRLPTMMLVWLALVLFSFLVVSGAVDGLLGIDIVALVFGAMSPDTRLIYGFVGVAAVSCAIALAVRHSAWPLRHPLRRAGR
jgi:uncharacterized membrane protein YuzA (DUF378 family)